MSDPTAPTTTATTSQQPGAVTADPRRNVPVVALGRFPTVCSSQVIEAAEVDLWASADDVDRLLRDTVNLTGDVDAPVPVVLGWGLGVESTAILTRWLLEPDSRNFDLDQLTVVTALTGDEFDVTHQLIETHLLGLLRDHGVRWVQVCRAGQSDQDGIVVVDDSRTATVSHRAGPWRLSQELIAAGTVPQYASGRRLCSIRAKGSVLDRWLAEHVPGPFRHVIGFNADETSRATRDRSYSTVERASEYPLIDWGWDRTACERYLEQTFGVTWHKSACCFCPFRGGSTDELLRDWAADVDAAVEALLIERRSMALNPKMTLYAGGKSAAALVADQAPVIDLAVAERLAAIPHDVVEVRRIIPHAHGDITRKAPGWRSVRVVSTGSRDECEATLAVLAAEHDQVVDVDEFGIARVWHRRRSGQLPDIEWLHVVCPSGVNDKERPGFQARWDDLIGANARLFDPDALTEVPSA